MLTTAAYRSFVEAAGLTPRLAALAARADTSWSEVELQELTATFLGAPLPEETGAALNAAFSYASTGGAVAVRSSAVAEDLPGASFAGQYESLLGVEYDGLELAVRRCWASLWSAPAHAYRKARGLVDADVAMAVVVQIMVNAERSGVLFTVDPTSAEPGLMRAEVVPGLGEGLVSGKVTPEVFRLRRVDLRALEPAAPPFLGNLGRVALEIERHEGHPQDIEWSVNGAGLHILQSRPITAPPSSAGDGFDTPAIPEAIFTPVGVSEMLPGVLPPLLWTVNAPMLEDAFAALFRQLGIRPVPAAQPMVGRYRGRAALNLSLLTAAASQMPRGSAAEIERQYLGRVLTAPCDEPDRRRSGRARRARSALRALRLQKRLPLDSDVFLEAVELVLELRPDLGGADSTALLSYRRALRHLATRGVRIEVAVSASAAASYRALEVVLERWLGPDEAPLATQRLTAGRAREQAGGCAAVLGLWGVHCDHCRDPEVAHAVYEGAVEKTPERLQAVGEKAGPFLMIVEEGLRRAGCSAIYAGPAWDEDPTSFWSLVRHCREAAESPPAVSARGAADADGTRRELERRLTRNWKWRTTRVLTGQIVDVRRRLLRRLIADTGTFLTLREAVKSGLLRLGGEERRVVRELARRLARDGALGLDDDVWLLSDAELEALARGEAGPGTVVLQRRRQAWEAARMEPPLPEVFTGAPPTPVETSSPATAGVLRGWATSPGRVRGRALVVGDVADANSITPTDILVGHSTDPSWTPLFLIAAGIVMEQGGPLSHAAIVAREFGVPAVLNVKEATSRIRTGTMIVVDGTAGTVEIDERQAEEAA